VLERKSGPGVTHASVANDVSGDPKFRSIQVMPQLSHTFYIRGTKKSGSIPV
jgi:hypothetical protein